MPTYPAGHIDANGVVLLIQVNDTGDWLAEYDGRTLRYPTREKLEAALKRLTKRAAVQVAVAVVQIKKGFSSVTHVRATATGIHGANGNTLVTLHHGGRRGDTKEQVTRYTTQQGMWFGGDVTNEQIAQYNALVRAEAAAQSARRTMEDRLKIDLQKVVEAAIAARTSEDD